MNVCPSSSAKKYPLPIELAISGLLLVLALLGAKFLCPWLLFSDDSQAQYVPGYLEVGRLVLAGQLPIISSSSWLGGSILPEYQYAIFNPLCLLTSIAANFATGLDSVVFILTLPHIFFLGVALHLAAATLNLPHHACRLTCMLVGLSSFIVFWYASSWLPGLASFPWLVLSWASCHRLVYHKAHPIWWVLSLVGLGTAGWPYFLLVAVLIGVYYFIVAGATYRWKVFFGALAAALICAPAILPILEYTAYSLRSGYSSFDDMWRVNWDALLTSFAPLGPNMWQRFDWVYDRTPRPVAYFNVFVLFLTPLLIFNLKHLIKEDKQARDLLILSICFIFLVGFPLPSMWRWPFRFLPVAYFFLTLLFVKVIFLETASKPSYKAYLLSAVIGSALILQQPQKTAQIVYNIAAIWLACALFIYAIKHNSKICTGVLVSYSLCVLFCQAHFYRSRIPTALWSLDKQVYSHGSTKLSMGLFDLGDVYAGGAWNFGVMGNVGRLTNTPTLNGYSPFGLKGPTEKIFSGASTGHLGGSKVDIISTFLQVPGPCNLNWLDLFGLERLVVFPSHQQAVAAQLGALAHWNRVDFGNVWTFTRELENSSSPIACSSGSLALRSAYTSNRELVFNIDEKQSEASKLYLRRLWIPGYRASLNNQPLLVEAFDGMLVQVSIPANVSGKLKIYYWPQSLQIGIYLAVLGLALSGMILKSRTFKIVNT